MGISAVVTSAAVNMGVQAPLCASELHSLGRPPRRVELDQLLLVLRNLHSGCTAFYPCQQECDLLSNTSHILSKIYEHITYAFLMALVCLWSQQWLHSEIRNAEDDNILIVSLETEKA